MWAEVPADENGHTSGKVRIDGDGEGNEPGPSLGGRKSVGGSSRAEVEDEGVCLAAGGATEEAVGLMDRRAEARVRGMRDWDCARGVLTCRIPRGAGR